MGDLPAKSVGNVLKMRLPIAVSTPRRTRWMRKISRPQQMMEEIRLAEEYYAYGVQANGV